MPDHHHRDIASHYSTDGLTDRIIKALRDSDVDLSRLTCDDLSPLDQFHVRGRDATIELASAAGITTGLRVLDIGGGIGGPARILARDYGCYVTVADLTEEYCRTGCYLTELTGLSRRLQFCNANALQLPFPAASFDVVWQQHCSMNIADKHALCREVVRVLKPSGRLALYEILAGNGEVLYPVPWASTPAISHLATIEQMKDALVGSGLAITSWSDHTSQGAEWFHARLANSGTAPRVGLHLLIGDAATVMFRNLLENLRRESVRLVQVVCQRP